MNAKRIFLAGGSGFCGQLVAERLAPKGWEIVVLTRSVNSGFKSARQVQWDGESLGDWAKELDGADVVINFSGRSVNCRYHAKNRRLILDSRVLSTRAIGQAIAQCHRPPRLWLNASTATIYQHSFDRVMDENGEIAGTRDAKDEFSVEVAQAWEKTFAGAITPKTRHVAMRMAMVFSAKRDTVFRVLRRLVKRGLGGTLAGGQQFVSWIHEDDYANAIEWLIEREDISGPVNMVSPNPLTNREMMQTLRHVCGAPFGMPAARWMLEIGAFLMGTETELVIKSRRVVPTRLTASGFQFQFPQFGDAIRDLERKL